MQTRFLKFVLGLSLIYIASLIVTVNHQFLFKGEFQGEIKIVFEQNGNTSLKDIQTWMGEIGGIQKCFIDVYKYENNIEVIIPSRDGNTINSTKVKDSVVQYGLPLKMISLEKSFFSMNRKIRFMLYAFLGILFGGGLYFIFISAKPSLCEDQIKLG